MVEREGGLYILSRTKGCRNGNFIQKSESMITVGVSSLIKLILKVK